MIPWNVPASIMCLFMHSYSCVHQDKDEEDYVEWLKGQTDVEGAEELQDMVSVCVILQYCVETGLNTAIGRNTAVLG